MAWLAAAIQISAAQPTLMQQVEALSHAYYVCVQRSSIEFARSSSESATTVAEAAIGSCVQAEAHARRAFVDLMVGRAGIDVGDAQRAWDEEAAELATLSRRMAIATTIFVRAHPEWQPPPEYR